MNRTELLAALAAERTKLPTVDHNGRPVTPAPEPVQRPPAEVPAGLRVRADIARIRREAAARSNPPGNDAA